MVSIQASLIKVNPLVVVILHIPEICVILCVCAYAECTGEDTSRNLGQNVQEGFRRE